MKGQGSTEPFHRFTNPRCDKSVYFWSWGSYLLFISPAGIQSVDINLSSGQVIVESTLNSGSLQQLIESTGRRAVLKGMGGTCSKSMFYDSAAMSG